MYTHTSTPLAVTTRLLFYPVVQVSNRLALNLYSSQQMFTARSCYRVIERQLYHREVGCDGRCTDHNKNITYYIVVVSVIRAGFGARVPVQYGVQ
jgi:hypothetical protein